MNVSEDFGVAFGSAGVGGQFSVGFPAHETVKDAIEYIKSKAS